MFTKSFKTIINHNILWTYVCEYNIFPIPEYTHTYFHLEIRCPIMSIQGKWCFKKRYGVYSQLRELRVVRCTSHQLDTQDLKNQFSHIWIWHCMGLGVLFIYLFICKILYRGRKNCLSCLIVIKISIAWLLFEYIGSSPRRTPSH